MFVRIPRIKCSDFGVLSHNQLSDFYTSAWQRGGSALPMLVVRVVLAGVALGSLAWSLVDVRSSGGPKWLIYLTDWGLLLNAAMTLSGLLVSAINTWKKLPDDAEAPWYVGLYWVLFNIGQNIALIVTLLYWTLLYDPDVIEYEAPWGFWQDVSSHGVNSVVSVGELLAARTPVRWLHVYQPLLLGVSYVAFSGIYFAAGGTDKFGNPYIYTLLDWNEPGAAGAVAGGSVAGLLALHSALWAAARARNKLSDRLRRRGTHDLPHTFDKV